MRCASVRKRAHTHTHTHEHVCARMHTSTHARARAGSAAPQVPHLCPRMEADARSLTSSLASCRAAARAPLAAARASAELTPCMDQGYREAERCGLWRRRVQEFTQQQQGCEDAGALSAVLTAMDVINQALQVRV